MKFKIIFSAVMVAMLVAIVSSVNITTDNINENKAGLTRLNKSFLSLSEEFESINRNSELVEQVTMSYRNSLINLSDRVDKLEVTAYDIHSILKDLDESRLNTMMQKVPMGRMGETKEIANTVYFLSTEESSYITGQVLHVNGGLTM